MSARGPVVITTAALLDYRIGHAFPHVFSRRRRRGSEMSEAAEVDERFPGSRLVVHVTHFAFASPLPAATRPLHLDAVTLAEPVCVRSRSCEVCLPADGGEERRLCARLPPRGATDICSNTRGWWCENIENVRIKNLMVSYSIRPSNGVVTIRKCEYISNTFRILQNVKCAEIGL